jgi:ferric-dicitrate binding protein FerR (iron transport regulator)
MNSPGDDERDIARVLAPLRDVPSAAARERAFTRIQQEFATSHTPRRHVGRWAATAGVVLALFAGWTWWSMRAPPAFVARVEALDGVVESRDGSLFGGASRLVTGAAVASGSDLDVGEGAGVLLRISRDLTVRLAENSRARFDAADRLVLGAGQAFVDATPGVHAPLRVITPSGEVTHLGTQYLVRAGDHEVEVAVREGRAQLRSAGLITVAEAGHWLLRRDSVAAPLTGELAADDTRFAWIADLPTGFKLEGSTLSAFLAWFQRETGLTPVYSDGIDAGKFAQVQLKGSIAELGPFDALSYVLATADLAWHREGSNVVIEKRHAGNG